VRRLASWVGVKGTCASITSGWRATCQGDPMLPFPLRGKHLSTLGLLTAILAAGCASFTSYGDGILKGRVLVQWDRQDEFIYINKLEEIVWARTKYAQSLWERPPTQKECETPLSRRPHESGSACPRQKPL
jgi:hypothetical protein